MNSSILRGTLDCRILLTTIVETGRPGDWRAVAARHLGLHIPLEEVKHWIPPCVGEIVVW